MPDPKVSELVAERVRHYRDRLDWTRERLADECAKLGAPELTASAITYIELGRKDRRRDITVDELLILAYALGVPPVLLFIPLGEADEVTIVPSVTVHPHLAWEWAVGFEAPMTSERELAAFPQGGRKMQKGADSYYTTAIPIRLHSELRSALNSMDAADASLRHAQASQAPEKAIQAAYDHYAMATSTLARLLDEFAEAGVLIPQLSRERVDQIRTFVKDTTARKLRVFSPEATS